MNCIFITFRGTGSTAILEGDPELLHALKVAGQDQKEGKQSSRCGDAPGNSTGVSASPFTPALQDTSVSNASKRQVVELPAKVFRQQPCASISSVGIGRKALV